MTAIVIGASAGGVKLIPQLMKALPNAFPFPIFIVQHIPADMPDSFIDTMQTHTAMRVKEASHFDTIQPGNIYFAPADYHLLVESEHYLALSQDSRVHFVRPSIDVLFESAAEVFQNSLIGIILTGANEDGVSGAKHIKKYGGIVLAQDPKTAESPLMPQAVINALQLSKRECLTPNKLVRYLLKLK